MRRIIPYTMESKKCLKPPTRTGCTTKRTLLVVLYRSICSCLVATNIHPSLAEQQNDHMKHVEYVCWMNKRRVQVIQYRYTGSYAYHMHISAITKPKSRSSVHSLKHHILCHLWWSIFLLLWSKVSKMYENVRWKQPWKLGSYLI